MKQYEEIKLGALSCLDFTDDCKGCPLKAWDVCLREDSLQDIKNVLDNLALDRVIKVEV